MAPLRIAAPVLLALLCACSRTPTAPEAASGPATSDPAGTARHDEDGAALLAAFLAEDGEDLEACFDDLPVLDDTGAEATFGDAGPPRAVAARRVVVAIDASGSMAGRAGAGSKMQAAKDAAAAFVAGLPADVEVGLVAFGHAGSNREADRAASCAAVDTVLAPGAGRDGVRAALAGFDATGWTPLAAAIARAGADLGIAADGGLQAVYVVSDGEDTCGGDPVAAARALHEGGTRAIVEVIGFDLAEADRAQLRAVADAGGGSFTEVRGAEPRRLLETLQRRSRDTVARAHARTGTAVRQARNTTATSVAVAGLRTCLALGVTRERNAANRPSIRRSPDVAALDAALGDRHRDLEARAARHVDAAERAQRRTNDGLDAAQRRVDRDYEARHGRDQDP